MKFQGQCGEIEITEKALKKLVYYSLAELSETMALSAKGWFQKMLSNFLSEESNVKISEGEALQIDLYVTVDYGVSIPSLYNSILEKIKETFRTHLGLERLDLNLHVMDVKEQKAAE